MYGRVPTSIVRVVIAPLSVHALTVVIISPKSDPHTQPARNIFGNFYSDILEAPARKDKEIF